MDDRATAARLLDQITFSSTKADDISAIVAALEAARRSVTDAARGSIIDCTGEVPVVRRVLGTLPVTADGAVICNFAEVFDINGLRAECDCRIVGPVIFRVDDASRYVKEYAPDECYSTPEAAKAAMEGGRA
jgi:hypothetical protein